MSAYKFLGLAVVFFMVSAYITAALCWIGVVTIGEEADKLMIVPSIICVGCAIICGLIQIANGIIDIIREYRRY